LSAHQGFTEPSAVSPQQGSHVFEMPSLFSLQRGFGHCPTLIPIFDLKWHQTKSDFSESNLKRE